MPLYFFLIFHLLIFFRGELGLEVHMTLLKLYLVLPPCYPVLLYACMAVLDSSRLLGGGRLLRLHLWLVRVHALLPHSQRRARAEPRLVVFLAWLQHRAARDEVVGHRMGLIALVPLVAPPSHVGAAFLWGFKGLLHHVFCCREQALLPQLLLLVLPAIVHPGG